MAKKRQTQAQIQQPVFSPLVFGTTIRQALPAKQGMSLQRNQNPQLTPNLESPQQKQRKVSQRLLGDPAHQVVDPNTGQLAPTTGLVAFQLGTHTQMWRAQRHGGAGARLGSTEFLESQVILLIQLNYGLLDLYNDLLKRTPPFRPITESELLNHIKTYIYQPLILDIEREIDRVVPSDSGRLRNTMKLSLGRGSGGASSMISGLNPFTLVINTGRLNYAGPVNQMPTEWLRHPGTHGPSMSQRTGRTVRRSPHPLNDPDAETHWFETVVTFGRIEAQQRWQNYITFIFPNHPKIQDLQSAYQRIGQTSLSSQFLGQSLFEVSFS